MVHSKQKYPAANYLLYHNFAKYSKWNRSENERFSRACCKVTVARHVETEEIETGEVEDIKGDQNSQYDFSEHEDYIVSRINTVNSEEGENYYLRTLLLHISGAKCSEDFCSVCGEVCATLREACGKRGLPVDYELWKCTLRESFQSHFVALSRKCLPYF